MDNGSNTALTSLAATRLQHWQVVRHIHWYLCTHICTYTHIHIWIFICMYIYIYIHMYPELTGCEAHGRCTCATSGTRCALWGKIITARLWGTSIYICIHKYIYVRVQIYIYIYICVQEYAYMDMYTCMLIDIYICIQHWQVVRHTAGSCSAPAPLRVRGARCEAPLPGFEAHQALTGYDALAWAISVRKSLRPLKLSAPAGGGAAPGPLRVRGERYEGHSPLSEYKAYILGWPTRTHQPVSSLPVFS